MVYSSSNEIDDDLLSSVYENEDGELFHEWIVTNPGTAEGPWGEGYVIRTADPHLVFKWGYANPEEAEDLSGSYELDPETVVGVLLVSADGFVDLDQDALQEQVSRALWALAQKLQRDDANDAEEDLLCAIAEFEAKESIETSAQVLADVLAQTCAELTGEGPSELTVADGSPFVSATVTVDVHEYGSDSAN